MTPEIDRNQKQLLLVLVEKRKGERYRKLQVFKSCIIWSKATTASKK